MKKFEPIDNNHVNKIFNDRRISDKMGVPKTPEKGRDYGFLPRKKSGPHENPNDLGYPDSKGLGGVKPKPKGPKPTMPWGTAKKVPK